MHIASNLFENDFTVLNSYSVKNCYAWTYSTVVLHWIQSGEIYGQFVSNRVYKIKSLKGMYQQRKILQNLEAENVWHSIWLKVGLLDHTGFQREVNGL